MTFGLTGWRWGVAPDDSRELRRHLNERLQSLEALLEEVLNVVRDGPVAGAYFPVHLSFREPAGFASLSLPWNADLAPLPIELTPIALTAHVYGGGVTIQIKAGGGTNVTNSLAFTSSHTLRGHREFLVDKVGAGHGGNVFLQIQSVDSGTPTQVRATLWCKYLSRLEDT